MHTKSPALGKLRQKDSEYEVNLDHTEFQARQSHRRPCLTEAEVGVGGWGSLTNSEQRGKYGFVQ